MLLSLLLTPGLSLLCMYPHTYTFSSLIPRPPPFFVLRFAFSIIHRSGRVRKTGKAWSHPWREWCQVDVRWTSGGSENDIRGRRPTAKTTHWIIRSSALPQMLAWSKLLAFTGKKLALQVYSLHTWILAPPTTSTDVTHVMDETLLSHSSASEYYIERKPKNKKQGRPGNEATHSGIISLVYPTYTFRYYLSCVFACTHSGIVSLVYLHVHTFRYYLSCVSTCAHIQVLSLLCIYTRTHGHTHFILHMYPYTHDHTVQTHQVLDEFRRQPVVVGTQLREDITQGQWWTLRWTGVWVYTEGVP